MSSDGYHVQGEPDDGANHLTGESAHGHGIISTHEAFTKEEAIAQMMEQTAHALSSLSALIRKMQTTHYMTHSSSYSHAPNGRDGRDEYYPPAHQYGGHSRNRSRRTKNTGLWTEEEKKRFDEGHRLYGKKWHLVAKHVETRTAQQCRGRMKTLNTSHHRSDGELNIKNTHEHIGVGSQRKPQSEEDSEEDEDAGIDSDTHGPLNHAVSSSHMLGLRMGGLNPSPMQHSALMSAHHHMSNPSHSLMNHHTMLGSHPQHHHMMGMHSSNHVNTPQSTHQSLFPMHHLPGGQHPLGQDHIGSMYGSQ